MDEKVAVYREAKLWWIPSCRTYCLRTLMFFGKFGLFFPEYWNKTKWKSLSHVWLFVTPWTIESMQFSRPEYWSEKPFPSPRVLPNPGIKLRFPALQVDSLPSEQVLNKYFDWMNKLVNKWSQCHGTLFQILITHKY